MNPTKHWMMWRMTCLGHTCESDNAISIWSNLTNLIWHYDIEVQFMLVDYIWLYMGASLVAQVVKNLLQCGRPGFNPWVRKIPWRSKWQPTPIFLPGDSHGQRSLVGYSPCRLKEELDTTEWLTLLGGFPGGSDGKESACNSGDPGSIPELGRSPGEV